MGYTKNPPSSLNGLLLSNHMNRSRLSLLIPALLLTIAAHSSSVVAQDHVTVQPRKVVIHRSAKQAAGFPERRKATVRYPIVSGLSDVIVLRRIQNMLSMKNVFGSTLPEYRRNPGLLEFDYKVNYNKNYLLHVTFTEDAEGAYPTTSTKHFLINLKNGKIIKASDAFNPDSPAALVRLVEPKLRAEIKEILQSNEEDKSADADAKKWVRDELTKLKYGVRNLDNFYADDKGVTFLYDAEFPHAVQALAPAGDYFFTYAELRPYIKGNGPLGVFK
jgi:hypothetical protein